MNAGYSICDHHHDQTCNACLEEARREERQRAAWIIRGLLDMVEAILDEEQEKCHDAAEAYIAETEARP
jgi:hypothetical protein